MTDELAPFFESRETRMGRLPAEARDKLRTVAQTVPLGGLQDYEDKQFVSLWLSRRVGLPRKDVLDNFDKIAARFFGEGTTAGGAYDRIASTYKPAGEKPAEADADASAAPAAEDAEFAPTEGLARVGKGFFSELADMAGQSIRSVGGGFEGFGQQVPAGLYSQAAAVTGAPALPSPMANPEYAALWKQKENILNPWQFTEVSSNEISGISGAQYEALANDPTVKAAETRMGEIVREMDTKYRTDWKAWSDSQLGSVSKEYRRLSDFWYKLSDGALDRWNVTPEFRQTTIGQFMQSAGSVPATAALAAMGPGGWVGMESSFFAQVEGERREAEGAAYDPDAALPANLASAVPQMVLERALGVERLMNKVLGELPKHAGKIRFGDFAKVFAKQSFVSAVEEGIENPAQGAWNDYMASLSYDEKREVLTGAGAKRRLVEGVSGFILGGFFGGVVSTANVSDQNRRVSAGAEYLTTKDGQPYAAEDFNVLRSVKTDQEILAQAPDAETGRLLLAAANGDKTAQADYNKRTLDRLFVKTEGEEVGGLALGQVNGVPVVRMTDGQIVPLDMTQAEDRLFVDNLKKEVVRQQALKETVGFLQKGLEAGREVEVSEQERTLQDFIREAKVNVDDAAARIGIANDVNEANLPEGVKPEDVRVLGANVAEYQQGVYRDVSTIYQGGTALTAVEEVAEGYIKKRLAVGDVFENEVAQWRASYEAETGTTTTTKGRTSDIEWFSKRVVDYAVANRKAPGMPASLNSFFRTLGEHLRTVFRTAQRLMKLKRSGKLDANFENHLKAALGMMTAGDVATARTQAGRAARQAELEEAFAGLDTNEAFRSEALDYQRLKEQLRAEADAASAAEIRARDFTRARMEEKLQGMIDNQLAGDESLMLDAPLTPEQKWTLKAAKRARDDGMTVRLSKQAQSLMESEGYDEVGAPWTASRPAKSQSKPEGQPPVGLNDAMTDAEAAALMEPTQAVDLDAEMLAFAESQSDFPTVAQVDGKFEVTTPDGRSLGAFDTQEQAVNRALRSYEESYRAEEIETVTKAHAADAGLTRLLTDIKLLGGLRSWADDPGFGGELRAIADGLPFHLRMKLFRKTKRGPVRQSVDRGSGSRVGKGALDLDSLRESLNEQGYRYDTITEMLDDIDMAVRHLAEQNARGFTVTFSLAERVARAKQTDMFAGGETGGDTMFNLQGEEAKDYTGVVDRQAESAEAKRKAAADQGEMTFSLTPMKDGQLLAVINTDERKLRHIAELGGLPVPSAAIIRPGVSNFRSFGDITLVLPPSLVDPRTESAAKVFNADVYSPRFPQGVRYVVDTKTRRQVWKNLAKESEALGNVLSTELDEDVLEQKGLEAFEESAAVMMAFLKSKKIKPDLKMRAVEELPPALTAFKGTNRWDIADNADFQKAAGDFMRAQLAGAPDLMEDYFDETGVLRSGTLNEIAGKVVLTNHPEVDRYQSEAAFKEQIEKGDMAADFKAWVKATFGGVVKGKRIRDYNERTDRISYLPYNLDSVVRIMRRGLRDGEGFNYGVGSLRSNVAKQFKTLNEMRASADSIITEERMSDLKNETDAVFQRIAAELAPFYRFESNRFGYLDEVTTAMKELATQGVRKWDEHFKPVPAALMKDVRDFLQTLATMPTEYFEAKIQRGVSLSEMVGAVIPSDTDQDVRDLLTKAGVRLIEYDGKSQTARAEALQNFADMTFALAGPANQTQALQQQAAKIQAKRMAATGQLLRTIQAGQTIPKRVAAVRRTQQASLLARVAVPLSSRLSAIAPSLKTRMRQFEFNLSQSLLRDMEAVTPFLRGMEGMKDTDAAVLDLALKNGDTATRDALLNAYSLQASFAQVQAMLAATRQRALAAGYEVGEIPDYFPRHVLDVDGLMTHYYGKPQAGAIEQAITQAAERALAQGRVLTMDERIEAVNNVLRGYGPKDGKPSNIKARKTDVVDMFANVYYADSAHALATYVETMNAAIEKRRFFGKSGQILPSVTPGGAPKLNLMTSIGAYVEELIAAGEITRAQQREVSDLLEARFDMQASSEFIKAFKTLGYITTMGKVTSAITQVQDLAFSLYENGVFDTMVAASRATVKQSKITKKALGLEAMADEFRDSGKLSKLLQMTFKMTGLTYVDGIGKETVVNAKFRRMSREARAGKLSPRSQAIIERIFAPADQARVIAELATDQRTEDTLFAVYNVLADYQPIAASEYPEAYLRHPNGRVFYMLKTFTLKQIDAFRREGITLIVHGNAKQKAQGFRNLTHLTALLFLVGVPVDWLKDFIMGRDPQLPDIAVDNVFKLMGVSRWNLWRFRDHKDPIRAAMELVTPPAPFLSYPIADVFDAAEQVAKGEDIDPSQFESWKILPFFGDPIYWFLGGGRTKVEKRRREREGEISGNRVRNR